MTNWIRKLLAASAVTSVMVGLMLSPASAGQGKNDLAAVKKATARFHSLEQATKAGYSPLLACFDLPGVGGMGQHLVKGKLLDGEVNATEPEALVYEVDEDELTLVAVEYIIPYTARPATAKPPKLFGHSFFRNDTLSLWALHAWIWRSNPLGTFANYNPNVDMCPHHSEGGD